jgi:hypothetical protein
MTTNVHGYDRLRRWWAQADVWGAWPITFGFDVLDTIEYGYGAWGFDVVDVINEGRELDIPTRCTECGEEWLMGPESLAAGKCWSCRTNGGAA